MNDLGVGFVVAILVVAIFLSLFPEKTNDE